MERKRIVSNQEWNTREVMNLMEYFIESHELGEQFDAFLQDTADKEIHEATNKATKEEA